MRKVSTRHRKAAAKGASQCIPHLKITYLLLILTQAAAFGNPHGRKICLFKAQMRLFFFNKHIRFAASFAKIALKRNKPAFTAQGCLYKLADRRERRLHRFRNAARLRRPCLSCRPHRLSPRARYLPPQVLRILLRNRFRAEYQR